MTALATLAQLTERLGTAPTSSTRAEALLLDASATVRAFTGQTISRATSTVRLVPTLGRLRLPQHPVISVDAATDDTGAVLDLTWPTTAWDLAVVQAGVPATITYTHGWATVPDIVVAVVCQIAGRALGMPSPATGVQSESLGAYSYSVGTAAASGPLGMLPGEQAALQGLFRPRRPISMIG